MNFFRGLFSVLFLVFSSTISSHSVCILIHGTWASTAPWYRPGGDFFQAVEQEFGKDVHCVSFTWSGSNNINARKEAANQLVRLIESYPTDTEIIIIAHSHGGNVALLASHALSGAVELNKYRINRLYTLGVPVDPLMYKPNMQNIRYLFNLFSFNDLVQPVLGIFEREFPPHPRCANLRVVVNNEQPRHSGLHDPLIGSWLLFLKPEMPSNIQNFHAFNFTDPGVLFFENNQTPRYVFDTDRQNNLVADKKRIALYRHAFIQRYQPTAETDIEALLSKSMRL